MSIVWGIGSTRVINNDQFFIKEESYYDNEKKNMEGKDDKITNLCVIWAKNS